MFFDIPCLPAMDKRYHYGRLCRRKRLGVIQFDEKGINPLLSYENIIVAYESPIKKGFCMSSGGNPL